MVKSRNAPPLAERHAQVDPATVELGADRVLRQPWPDRGGDLERRGAGGHAALGAVGQSQYDFRWGPDRIPEWRAKSSSNGQLGSGKRARVLVGAPGLEPGTSTV